MSAQIASPSEVARPGAAAPAKRRYFKLKSEWAAFEASKISKQIDDLQRNRVPSSDWRAVKQKVSALANLRTQLTDWNRRAANYRDEEAGRPVYRTAPARRRDSAKIYGRR